MKLNRSQLCVHVAESPPVWGRGLKLITRR